MPQLMPLYWIVSSFIIFLLLLIVVDCFFYKMLYNILVKESVMIQFKNVNLKW